MLKNAFRDRERALENEFFFEVDKKLLANLKAQLDAESQHQQLAEATGFDDQQLLDELIELGISVEAITAMSLIPMVLVAWADKRVDPLERSAVLRVALEQGVSPDSPAGKLLTHWLAIRPTPQLAETWKHFTQAITREMTPGVRKTLRADVLNRARAVAAVSGGPLWMGVITANQKRVIAELSDVLMA